MFPTLVSDCLTLEGRPIASLKTSVRNYHSMQHEIAIAQISDAENLILVCS
jgi:hypothetical protein